MNLEDRKIKYLEVAKGIADYLAALQTPSGDFPARNFYGVEMAMALWNSFGNQHYEQNLKKACDFSNSIFEFAKYTTIQDFHWEFRILGRFWANELPSFYKYRDNRNVINWRLMKSLIQIVCGGEFDKRYLLRTLMDQVTCNDGGGYADCMSENYFPKYDHNEKLLYDEDVFSHQYHIFSTFLISEIMKYCPKFKDEGFSCEVEPYYDHAMQFIANKMLDKDGDCNWFGRGKRQIFGYGVAIYCLETYKRGDLAVQVLDFINIYRREDGSFPLFLNQFEHGYPIQTPEEDPIRWVGWESYNNYFDYLPLLGYMLVRAAHVVGEYCETKSKKIPT